VVNGYCTHVDVELADSILRRARGLLGRQRISGCLLLTPCKSVHGAGMFRALDVAYLDAAGNVLETTVLLPWRMHRPRWNARSALEAERGMLAAWGITVGGMVTLRDM
jgi:uncharacterized protein